MHILQTPCAWYFVLNSDSNLLVPFEFCTQWNSNNFYCIYTICVLNAIIFFGINL